MTGVRRVFDRGWSKICAGGRQLRACGPFDGWLLAALLIGLILGLQGFTWGKYDCLNLDRMALRNMTASDRPYLHPKFFAKPPFYTYMNHFLARLPAEALVKKVTRPDSPDRKQVYLFLRLAFARSLNLLFFASVIILVFLPVRQAFGLEAARMSALVLASSAGFIPYQVFLTTDLALVFMMLAAFWCAVRIADHPGIGISIAGGLLTGLATATKYNGLIVAAALPVAHLLASRGNPILACLKRPAAWICGLAVPIGFIVGNPYAVLDWPTFSGDFLFNYKVTPIYNGVTEGHSYGFFFWKFSEIFGWPGTWLILAGVLVGLYPLLTARSKSMWNLWVLASVVFVVYTWKIGGFPRIETRFVLPMAPFALMLAAAGFTVFLRLRFVAISLFALLIAYNLACGWWVGELFRKDPRMEALAFAEKNVLGHDKVEISSSIPRLEDLPGRKLEIIKIPTGFARDAIFRKNFADDEQMQDVMGRWLNKDGPEWFSVEARAARNPDWIFWSDIDVEGLIRPQFEALKQGGQGYDIVFQGASPTLPPWAYPRFTEFLRNRVNVWKKSAAASVQSPSPAS